jgi:hypothetical protein
MLVWRRVPSLPAYRLARADGAVEDYAALRATAAAVVAPAHCAAPRRAALRLRKKRADHAHRSPDMRSYISRFFMHYALVELA